LGQFGHVRSQATVQYVSFVHQGARLPSVRAQLQGQIFLGSVDFVSNMQALIDEKNPSLEEITRAQRRVITQPLVDFEVNYSRQEAMVRAYLSGQHTMAAIGKHCGVHYATVSRAVKDFEKTEGE
jgi:putative transposase